MRNNLKILSILLLLFINCFLLSLLLSATENMKISLKEVLSIGTLEDSLIFRWAGVTTDSNDNIYITDDMDYSIKKFNSKGALIKKTGRRGVGPAEFLAPRLIKYFNGLLYVTDQYILGIKVFDEDLNYKHSIPIRVPVADLKILSKEFIAVSSFSSKGYGSIMFFDVKGNLIKEIKCSERGSNPMLNLFKFEIDKEGDIYTVLTFQDRIEKFDKNGKKLWSKSLIKNPKVKMIKTEVGPIKELPEEVIYKDIEFDSFENIFILGGHLSKNRSRDIYVINKKGNHITTFTLPHDSHLFHIDSKNFLYTRANQAITLKKYFIIYENPK